MEKEIKRKHVKMWVVKTAAVTKPYRKDPWYAAITLAYDYSASGKTIEAAYNKLTDQFFHSPFIMDQIKNFDSFKIIVEQN